MKISELIKQLEIAKKEIGDCEVLADYWQIDRVVQIKEYESGDNIQPIVNLA